MFHNFAPFSRGKNRILRGVENRGSLISVPLALVFFFFFIFGREILQEIWREFCGLFEPTQINSVQTRCAL